MSEKYNMMNDISSVLLSEEEIKNTVEKLGAKISEDYNGKRLLIVGTLKGALPFMGALLGKITIPCYEGLVLRKRNKDQRSDKGFA